jgi:hypothetical protein
MWDRIGKGSVRGKAAAAGGRGDIELYAPQMAMLGGTGDLALAAQLEVGQIDVRGTWTGTPEGDLGKLLSGKAPKVVPGDASGFAAADLTMLFGAAPPVPIAGGVTLPQLAASLKGPVTVTIPAGTVDIEIRAPLNDPAPAKSIVEHCDELEIFEKAPQQQPGMCRFQLRGATVLELAAWVENNELRIGDHTGAPSPGKAGAMTQVARELAAGDWTAVLWGRGSMLNLSGVTPGSGDVPPEASFGFHAMSLLDEVGIGVRGDAKMGTAFRVFVRTVFANPADVVAKVVAISGSDIVTGKATQPAKAIAEGAPGTPFAADYAAGQGGMLIPSAVVGLAMQLGLPAFGVGAPGPDKPTAMDETQLVKLLVSAYAEEAYPRWMEQHPDKPCPSIKELGDILPIDPSIPRTVDPWGHELIVKCKDVPGKIGVMSVGPDGHEGTADDIRSW